MSNSARVEQEYSWFRGRRGAEGNFRRHGAHFFVDQAVSGENDGATKLVWISGKIANPTAGFFDQQDACGHVPFCKAEFPEAIEAAGGNTGEIQRSGAIAAHTVRVLSEVTVVLKIGARFAVAHGKAGTKQACGKRGDFGDVDFLAVKGGAFATRGGEKFVVKRIENRGGEERIALGECNRNAEARIAMGEIRGAVKRVNVPAKFRSGSTLVAGALFGGDGMFGKIFGEAFDDEPF